MGILTWQRQKPCFSVHPAEMKRLSGRAGVLPVVSGIRFRNTQKENLLYEKRRTDPSLHIPHNGYVRSTVTIRPVFIPA